MKLPPLKPLLWVGSSKRDLKEFPAEAAQRIGYALYLAQAGGKHSDAKPLRRYGGAGVLEVVESFDGNAYRAVYTVRYAEAIYALHCFQKKSTQGIATPQRELDLIQRRLERAEEMHFAFIKEKP